MRFGMPQPRFTYAPSVNSNAARWAICSRVSRALSAMALLSSGLTGESQALSLHNAVYKNRRGNHVFWRDRADRHNFIRFHDGHLRSHGHDGIEIPRGKPVRQISELISLF